LDAQELQAQLFAIVLKQEAVSFIIYVSIFVYLKPGILRIQCMSLLCHLQHGTI